MYLTHSRGEDIDNIVCGLHSDVFLDTGQCHPSILAQPTSAAKSFKILYIRLHGMLWNNSSRGEKMAEVSGGIS